MLREMMAKGAVHMQPGNLTPLAANEWGVSKDWFLSARKIIGCSVGLVSSEMIENYSEISQSRLLRVVRVQRAGRGLRADSLVALLRVQRDDPHTGVRDVARMVGFETRMLMET